MVLMLLMVLFSHLLVSCIITVVVIWVAVLTEPAQWLPPTQVQELQWLAEAVGRLCQLLHLLLQKLPGYTNVTFILG